MWVWAICLFTFRMKLNCNGDLILLFGIKSVFSLCLYTCACYMSVDRYERCFNWLCIMSENRNQRLSFAFASLLIARLFFSVNIISLSMMLSICTVPNHWGKKTDWSSFMFRSVILSFNVYLRFRFLFTAYIRSLRTMRVIIRNGNKMNETRKTTHRFAESETRCEQAPSRLTLYM